MRARRCFGMALGLVSFLLAHSGQAKDWQLRLAKGSTVVAKIPTRLWETPRRSVSLGFGKRIYVVDVDDVLAASDWQASGFPYCGEFTLAKVSKKSAYTEVELQNSSIYLKLHFSKGDDLESDFQKVVVPGDWGEFEGSEDFRSNVFAVQAAKIFAGPLAQLSDPLKLSLVRMVCNGQGTLGTETFKGKSYLAVSLADDGNIYNSLKLNQSAGAARVINDGTYILHSLNRNLQSFRVRHRLRYGRSLDTLRNFLNLPQGSYPSEAKRSPIRGILGKRRTHIP